MSEIDYEKYLVRRPVYEAFGGVKNRQSPTMTMMSSAQVSEAKYYIEPGWIYGIPEPNPSLHTHAHHYDATNLRCKYLPDKSHHVTSKFEQHVDKEKDYTEDD